MKDSEKLIPDWLWYGQWIAGFVCGVAAGIAIWDSVKGAAA